MHPFPGSPTVELQLTVHFWLFMNMLCSMFSKLLFNPIYSVEGASVMLENEEVVLDAGSPSAEVRLTVSDDMDCNPDPQRYTLTFVYTGPEDQYTVIRNDDTITIEVTEGKSWE